MAYRAFGEYENQNPMFGCRLRPPFHQIVWNTHHEPVPMILDTYLAQRHVSDLLAVPPAPTPTR